MTTFQNQPPPSRRSVRQSESAEHTDPQEIPRTTEPEQPRQYYGAPPLPRNVWDTVQRQGAQPPPSAVLPTGRRSSGAPVTGEPVDYTTQSRRPNPSYDGPFRNRPSQQPPSAPAGDQAPTLAMPRVEPAYRVKDFTPEPVAAPAPATEWPAPVAVPQPLPPPTVAAPSSAPTMTRRELRALQAAEDAAASPAAVEPAALAQPEVVDTILHSGPIELPLLASAPKANDALALAMAEFDALTRGSQLSDPVPAQVPAAVPLTPVERAAEAPAVVEPVAVDAPAQAWSAPPGHWSIQAQAEEQIEPFNAPINRTVGSGSTATSALVLAELPQPTLTSALRSTGEVMITGSIDLPRSLSSSGTSAGFEDEGIDSLFEPYDQEITSTDSAPVRAITAVSTQVSNGHGVTHTHKPSGNRMLTVLIISAVGMAVVAVGLLVAAMAFNVF